MKKNIFKDPNFIRCILLCLAISFASFMYFIIKERGAFVLAADFNEQQIAFATYLNMFLKSSDRGQWCWSLDLGTPLIYGFSFYDLGSPFFWLTMLFPAHFIPYVIGEIYIVKYIVAGAFAYLYIKMFVKDSKYAIVGAIFYAFSGFQSTNLLFYHFHDVVAFFPLLLIGLEKMMFKKDKKSKLLFIFAVFVNCVLNYFFFVEECIFLGFYFLFRFWRKPSELLAKLFTCVIYGMLGMGMASILFIPNIIYILSGARSNETMLYLSNLVCTPVDFLMNLKGFLLPGEPMRAMSCVSETNYNSVACYLPLAGISLVLCYIRKNKNWLSCIIIVLSLGSFIPIFSSVFLLFREYNMRWWYMLILLMSLASAIVLENVQEYDVFNGIAVNVVIVMVFFFLIKFLKVSDDIGIATFHSHQLYVEVFFTVFGLIIMEYIVRKHAGKYRYIVIMVAIYAFATTFSTIYLYQRSSDETADHFMQRYRLSARMNGVEEQYRYNSFENIVTLCGDNAGIGSFSSTVTNSISEFDSLFDYYMSNWRLNKNGISGLKELFAAAYTVTENDSDIVSQGALPEENTNSNTILNQACPIGFAMDQYISTNDLKAIPKDMRGIALLNAAVFENKDITSVSKVCSHFDIQNIGANSLEKLVKKNHGNAVDNFVRDGKGFSFDSDYQNDSLVYLSVPYDNGWHAKLDNKKLNIVESGGMMAVVVPQGYHRVVFSYCTPGFKVGIVISSLCWCIYVLLWLCKEKCESVKTVWSNEGVGKG